MRLKALWERIPEWGKAFLLALALLLAVHLFVLRWATVRSTSMYGTLLPGDLVAVERWPVVTGFRRGDIIVFRDPVQDDRPKGQRQLLIKRIAGLPGDKVELRDGVLLINSMPLPPPSQGTSLWTVRMKAGSDPGGLLQQLGLPPDFVLQGRSVIHLPLNEDLAAEALERPEVVSVEPYRQGARATGHLFPFSPNFRWTNENYGPLQVPAAGDTVPITAYTLPLYDRIITRYERNKVEVSGGELRINGEAAGQYAIRQDYYFVLGDSRDNSADSRYWGFVPADQVTGRAAFVLLNARSVRGASLPGRFLKDL